ncbi:hypothetical protein FHA84_19520 [Salmonella enterica subsp. enterica]|uniref:Uncharacterized protein n=1 Tax=Salmonella enterica TaxID=28901 RepID=A0A633DL80_SALER|nr:hypothetical protein [Salmonella enterica]EBA1163883.1 hypothetical protein [Salmonella enterica subsp. enterica]EBF8621882.1 hypothetical protein [Salmonella enterica subsp. enterica serovar Istanbul]EBQ9005206.1 hypothetical protein [Salmonella enterica subsp. enterica serovar Blockley]EBQ9480429.1 hypothetical protein [Salmonella enterica subsp. enterica serovar Kokomlemle]EBV8414137.1 hypothetical protein [Salmonella enterica subsp. enterica serovar Oranienburg]EBW2603405.1 hypothetica
MSEKIAIVYIGEKNVKRDTITGSRAVFPRLQSVHVDSKTAHQLLEFPDVWVRHEQMEAALKQHKEQQQLKAEQLAQQLEEEARLAAENSFVVNVQGDELDISKYTSAMLSTLCESEELGIQQGAQEKVNDFRIRVRQALKERGIKDGFAE